MPFLVNLTFLGIFHGLKVLLLYFLLIYSVFNIGRVRKWHSVNILTHLYGETKLTQT